MASPGVDTETVWLVIVVGEPSAAVPVQVLKIVTVAGSSFVLSVTGVEGGGTWVVNVVLSPAFEVGVVCRDDEGLEVGLLVGDVVGDCVGVVEVVGVVWVVLVGSGADVVVFTGGAEVVVVLLLGLSPPCLR